MKVYTIMDGGKPVMQVTEDVVIMLQRANDLSAGRQVLIYLFEWFLGVIAQVYVDQGIKPEDKIQLDESFFILLSRATKFGLRAYMMYEEVFAEDQPEGGDAEGAGVVGG